MPQDAIPDLKGTWTGKGKAMVFGNNAHHPGSQNPNDPPRVHEIEAKYVIDGQDGHLVWGRSSSTAANTQEPLAWAIASDNKTIYGADADGYYHITLVSPDRMEKCYIQNGNGPTHADRRRVLHDGSREAISAAALARIVRPKLVSPSRRPTSDRRRPR